MNYSTRGYLAICALAMLSTIKPAFAQESIKTCGNVEATSAYESGYKLQKNGNSGAALKEYRDCLALDPDCVPCYYEAGWSYWSRGNWKSTVNAWKEVLKLDPDNKEAKSWLRQARDKLSQAQTPSEESIRVRMGVKSKPTEAPLRLELIARFQNYRAKTNEEGDNYDQDIYSPKSVRFSQDGGKAYVNSLEGYRTVIYDPARLKKTGVIWHKFNDGNKDLFQEMESVYGYKFSRKPSSGNVNHFKGKPVESEISHDGKYLWAPYYRRDYDVGATSPSAVAIIDVETDEIIRVMPTGPIPKYIEASPDNKWLAIVHWGDNTVSIVDISSGDPHQFKYLGKPLVVERQLSQSGLAGKNRDKACGFCLRGSVFTPDSKTLLVARMGGGGIAGFDMETQTYLGTVLGMQPTPRHLVISKDGKNLFLSSNVSGYVSRIELDKVVQKLKVADKKRVYLKGWKEAYVGYGARTIDLSPDNRYIFTAVNGKSEIVVVDSETMDIVCRARTDSYTVGLAVSPDGGQVWTTSQGKKGGGGNSVCVYEVTRPSMPAIE